MTPDINTSGTTGGNRNGVPQQPNDLRQQQLELKNVVQLNLYICYESASMIKSQNVFGRSIQPRKIKEFYSAFWNVYNYVKSSNDGSKLNPDDIIIIDRWFELMQGSFHDTDLIMFGIKLFLEFGESLQGMGIGRLFERGIDPPFIGEDFENYELLVSGSAELEAN